MADRFNRIDNTAPITDVAEGLNPDVKYSNFDLSRKVVGQALPYALIPIDVIPTLPNTKINLNYDVQITFRNPAVRKLLNGFRVYLHSYYNRNSDLWEGWNNFITRGRTGKMNLKIPHIATRLKSQGGDYFSPFTPMSLYNYLGIPAEYIAKKNNIKILNKNCGYHPAWIETGTTTQNASETGLGHYQNIEITALKAMMYQRLYRDKYAPQNLLIKNENVFPENEDHFILSYNADEVNRIKYENEKAEYFNAPEGNIQNYLTLNGQVDYRLDLIRFRQFQGDRFTTASPFQDMLRGEAPTLPIEIDTSDLYIKLDKDTVMFDSIRTEYGSGEQTANGRMMGIGVDQNGRIEVKSDTPTYPTTEKNNGYNYVTNTKDIILQVQGEAIQSKIKLNDLRSLEVFTIFSERMARCSGSYNSMIKQQYGHNPKSESREAIYIGGSYQDILMNSIYQTSETTTQSETALGSQVAQGQSASYNKIGSFQADDYGYVMTIMSIVPETIYTTGINKLDTALTMEEQYFPIMNNLSAEPILNQELYVSGTKETDETPYGYAERFSEYKSRRNKAVGLSELSNTDDAYDSALVMARRFNQTQNLNATWVTGIPNNVSLDAFTSEEEAPFDFAIRQDINVTYPMPYVTIPQGLGTRA